MLVSIDGAVCVWAFAAVGDYIHPAVDTPRGQGENVIYALIMPAPPNTPSDRCNIFDISSSFIYSPSPVIPFLFSQLHTLPEPRADISSPHHNYRAVQVQSHCCDPRMFMHVWRTRVLFAAFPCISVYCFALLFCINLFLGGFGDQLCDSTTAPTPMRN